jgi:hypothetical protein
MGAIASLSDLVNRATGGSSGTPQLRTFFKDGRVGAAAAAAPIAGRVSSLWEYNGSPSHGVPPTTVAIPDDTTDGGLKQTDPGGGRSLWLVGGSLSCIAQGGLLVYDRLLHIGGLSGTNTGAQTVGGSLTRYTGSLAAGNEMWVEIYTQIGASSTTITASYTDQGGAGGTSPATAIGNTGFREAQRIIRLPLAAGDSGVQGVTSVTLAATTGTAGNFGVSIVRPLLWIPVTAVGVPSMRESVGGFAGLSGPVEVVPNACLAMAWISNGTTIPQFEGHLFFVEA